MFKSTSIASPFTTVTSSFVADRVCVVTLDSLLTVRVNGVRKTGGTYNLTYNDKIEVDVTAPDSDKHIFVPYSINGNPSAFAIASETVGGKPKLSTRYRSKVWFEFPTPDPTHQVSISRNGSNSYLTLSTSTTSAPTQDTVAVLDYLGNTVYFVNASGSVVSKVTVSRPVSQTRIFNGANRTWDFYVVGMDGVISKFDYQFTKSTVQQQSNLMYAQPNSLFTDGMNLWLGGYGFLHNLSVPGTAKAMRYDDSTVLYGTGAGGTVGIVTSLGNFMVLKDDAFVKVYSAKSLGKPTVFNNQFVVPSPEEYKIIFFDLQGNKLREISTGNRLPWVCNTGSSKLTVSCYDSAQVLVYDTADALTTVNMPKNAMSTHEIGGSYVASHYVSQTRTTYTSPTVDNLNIATWKAPVGALVSSGDKTITTEGENLPVSVYSGFKFYINNRDDLLTVSSGDRVSLTAKAARYPVSSAVVIGNYAFDLPVVGQEGEFISTELLPQSSGMAADLTKERSVSFQVTVPTLCQNAPVSVSRGTLYLNDVIYDGSTPVSGGDKLRVDMIVPVGSTLVSAVLNLADSQYPIMATTGTIQYVDEQKFQDYLSTETVSYYTIKDKGEYGLLDYSDTYVMLGENPVSLPANFEPGEILTVHHTRMSSWWLDDRYTALTGPRGFYVFTGTTTVDGIPLDLDFGTVHNGIPDFEFVGDKQPVVDGLSRFYAIKIKADKIKFSVNGADPVEEASITNGDKLTAFYTVKNLWQRQKIYTTLYTGDEVQVGWIDVDPPVGVEILPEDHELTSNDPVWLNGTFVSTNMIQINPLPFQASLLTGVAPVSDFFKYSAPTGVAPVSDFFKYSAPSGTAPVSDFFKYNAPTGIAPVSDFFKYSAPSGIAPISVFDHSANELNGVAPTSMFDHNSNALNGVAASPDWLSISNDTDVLTAVPLQAGLDNYVFVAPVVLHYEAVYGGTVQEIPGPKVRAKWEASAAKPAYGHTFRQIPGSADNKAARGTFWIKGAALAKVDISARRPTTQVWTVRQDRMKISDAIPRLVNTNWARHNWKTMSVERSADRFINTFVKFGWAPDKFTDVVMKVDTTWYKITNQLLFRAMDRQILQEKIIPVVIEPKFAAKSSLVAVSTGSRALPDTIFGVKANTALSGSEKLWETLIPLKTGGYATEAAALADGTVKSGTFTIQTYKQPEGSFSYTVIRETGLVCEIQPSVVTANKWLIGGG